MARAKQSYKSTKVTKPGKIPGPQSIVTKSGKSLGPQSDPIFVDHSHSPGLIFSQDRRRSSVFDGQFQYDSLKSVKTRRRSVKQPGEISSPPSLISV